MLPNKYTEVNVFVYHAIIRTRVMRKFVRMKPEGKCLALHSNGMQWAAPSVRAPLRLPGTLTRKGRANRSRICVLRESKPFKESFGAAEVLRDSYKSPTEFLCSPGCRNANFVAGPGGFRWVPHPYAFKGAVFQGLGKEGETVHAPKACTDPPLGTKGGAPAPPRRPAAAR